jgi:hypothetical protein
MCRAYGAGDAGWVVPRLAPWARFWRAYGAGCGDPRDRAVNSQAEACATGAAWHRIHRLKPVPPVWSLPAVHSERAFRVRNLSSAANRRGIPRFARNDEMAMVRTYAKSAPLGARIGDSAYPRRVGAATNGVLAMVPAATGRLGVTRRFVFLFRIRRLL